MNLNGYLEKGEPEKYNFELEFPCWEDLSVMGRYFIYKATGEAETGKLALLKYTRTYPSAGEYIKEIASNDVYKDIHDCDGSDGYMPLTHEIYGNLWGWKKGESTTFGQLEGGAFCCNFGGDTMNSAQTVVNLLLSEILSKKLIESKDWETLVQYKKGRVSIAYCLELMSHEDSKKVIEWLFNSKYPIMKEYLDLYHTIGNFVLVPAGFNGFRGLSLKDYWDKSLVYLMENGYGNVFKSSEFTRYINYFYLWDYMEDEHVVKMFSPSEQRSTEDFLSNACKFIKERGTFMVKMLRVREKLGAAKFVKLQNELFTEHSGCYVSTTDALDAVCRYVAREG